MKKVPRKKWEYRYVDAHTLTGKEEAEHLRRWGWECCSTGVYFQKWRRKVTA